MQASVQNIMLKLRSRVQFYARAYNSTLARTILRSSVGFLSVFVRALVCTRARLSVKFDAVCTVCTEY